jgi:hypothetical protein
MSVAEIVERALKENPDMRTVLEAAKRTREAEALHPPRDIGSWNEIVTIPINSQCLVPPETQH